MLNQLLRIEEELGDRAECPGWAALPRAETSTPAAVRSATLGA